MGLFSRELTDVSPDLSSQSSAVDLWHNGPVDLFRWQIVPYELRSQQQNRLALAVLMRVRPTVNQDRSLLPKKTRKSHNRKKDHYMSKLPLYAYNFTYSGNKPNCNTHEIKANINDVSARLNGIRNCFLRQTLRGPPGETAASFQRLAEISSRRRPDWKTFQRAAEPVGVLLQNKPTRAVGSQIYGLTKWFITLMQDVTPLETLCSLVSRCWVHPQMLFHCVSAKQEAVFAKWASFRSCRALRLRHVTGTNGDVVFLDTFVC